MSLAVGAIVAAELAGSRWSGLPVAVGALGAALASWPLSRLMDRTGQRRGGLALGYALAVVGAVLSVIGVMVRSFTLLLVGMGLFGISNTSNLLARYAAADVTEAPNRGKAMGFIVWGSTLGSIVGPNLMAPALAVGVLIGVTATASGFLISVAGFMLAALLIQTLLRPDPLALARRMEAATAVGRSVAPPRRLRAALGDVRVQIAFATLGVGQLVMIGTTSTSPVYLHMHGYPVPLIGIAVSLHLAGMYVASPLSGWLSDRFGRLPTIAAGAILLIAAVIVAGVAPGSARAIVIFALFLNGVGWNLAFVAGSALLTDALSPSERASIQGFADLALGLMGALGSTAGGMILGVWGFAVLNVVGAAFVLGPLAATLLRRPALAAAANRSSAA